MRGWSYQSQDIFRGGQKGAKSQQEFLRDGETGAATGETRLEKTLQRARRAAPSSLSSHMHQWRAQEVGERGKRSEKAVKRSRHCGEKATDGRVRESRQTQATTEKNRKQRARATLYRTNETEKTEPPKDRRETEKKAKTEKKKEKKEKKERETGKGWRRQNLKKASQTVLQRQLATSDACVGSRVSRRREKTDFLSSVLSHVLRPSLRLFLRLPPCWWKKLRGAKRKEITTANGGRRSRPTERVGQAKTKSKQK
ncbi:hypothetical protein TGARI_361840 [Toxoplasma gondii ARI]|uniref:Uncharacterized protein n=1 Tax=Toxoplasma gondii ARI TaxID=1074872 RepID=A0A139XNI9_TOXGO|nr:hypothetical protein TGARI_361840 [Toxoplasma gondii ARI]